MGKKVLVISDDTSLPEFLESHLPDKVYQLVATSTDQQLRRLLDRVRPDLLVVDIKMPDLEGIELCLRLRQWSDVPIIMLSAWGAGRNRVRGLDLSRDDHLGDPFDGPALADQIEQTLQRSTFSWN